MMFSDPCGILGIRLGVTACGKLLTFLREENRAPGLSVGSSETKEITRRGEASLRMWHISRQRDPLLESVKVFRAWGFLLIPSFFQLQVASGS